MEENKEAKIKLLREEFTNSTGITTISFYFHTLYLKWLEYKLLGINDDTDYSRFLNQKR